MFCKKCGKQLPENAKFCGVCGTSVQTEAASKAVPARKVKKATSAKKMLIGMAALAAIALVIMLISTLFSKKTVWLVTKEVCWKGDDKEVCEIVYDEDGHLLDYDDGQFDFLSYEYEDGRIVSAKVNGIVLEYIYDRNGHLEVIESKSHLGDIEVKCDGKGRIVEMESENGFSVTCSYHKNGQIKKVESKRNFSDMLVENTYLCSESGKLLEMIVYKNGEKNRTFSWEYDSQGRLVEKDCKYYYRDSSETEQWEYDEKGAWVGYTLKQEVYGGDKLKLECKVTGDRLCREAVITRIVGDSYFSDWMDSLEKGDVYMEETYDAYGNLIEQITYGVEKTKRTWEYEQRKVSRDYARPLFEIDPRYFYVIYYNFQY